MGIAKLGVGLVAFGLPLIAQGALAQNAKLEEIKNSVTVPGYELTADQIDDLEVYSMDGKDIGDVEDVVGRDENTPTHLVIDFDDDSGDSAYPDRDDVLLPIADGKLLDGHVVVSLTPDEVKSLPLRDD